MQQQQGILKSSRIGSYGPIHLTQEVMHMMFAMHRIDRKMEWINRLLETESVESLKLVAKKGVFECPYCSAPMSVRAGEKNVHHFAHPPNLACEKSQSVERAYHNYQKQIKRESMRQQVLVSLVKDELETANQDKQQVEVEYGYLVEHLDKYYPDVYVRIGGTEWAITIVSNLTEAENERYARDFKKRHNYFLKMQMQPLWLIDRSNLAIEKRHNGIVLWETESLGSMTTKEDYQWKTFLEEHATKAEWIAFFNYPQRGKDTAIAVKSIYYLTPSNESVGIRALRYIEDYSGKPSRGLFLGETYDITFAKALQINYESFRLSDAEIEQKLREDMKARFMVWKEEQRLLAEKRMEIEREEREAERRRKEYLERIRSERHDPKPEIDRKNTYKKSELTAKVLFGDGPIPVDYSPQEWKKMKRNGIRFPWQQDKRPLRESISNEKYIHFEEKILGVLIKGENYINGPSQEWRKVVLEYLNTEFQENEWHVSIRGVIVKLMEAGVTFNQKEPLVSAVIRQLLDKFKKELQNELRLKVSLVIVD